MLSKIDDLFRVISLNSVSCFSFNALSITSAISSDRLFLKFSRITSPFSQFYTYACNFQSRSLDCDLCQQLAFCFASFIKLPPLRSLIKYDQFKELLAFLCASTLYYSNAVMLADFYCALSAISSLRNSTSCIAYNSSSWVLNASVDRLREVDLSLAVSCVDLLVANCLFRYTLDCLFSTLLACSA